MQGCLAERQAAVHRLLLRLDAGGLAKLNALIGDMAVKFTELQHSHGDVLALTIILARPRAGQENVRR